MGARGQSWSMDLIIGVVIFLLAIGVIYAVLTSKAKEDITPLRIESEVVATKLTTTESSKDNELIVVTNNQLDEEKLTSLAEKAKTTEGYEALKAQLGVKNDFCIVLLDEKGNVVYLTDNNGNKYTGIGPADDNFKISGTPCGKIKS
jgi:flagellar basal body-associated protein FliL